MPIAQHPRAAASGAIGLGTVAIAAGAHLAFPLPGTEVLQTGQTLAVLLAGALAGPWLGASAVILYLISGALGLPIFADGAGGAHVLAGPSGGFLLGFVPAAVAAGLLVDQVRRHMPGPAPQLVALCLTMLACHLVILGCGWARLVMLTDAATAYAAGVAPFLGGAVVKSTVAAVLTMAVRPVRKRERTHIV